MAFVLDSTTPSRATTAAAAASSSFFAAEPNRQSAKSNNQNVHNGINESLRFSTVRLVISRHLVDEFANVQRPFKDSGPGIPFLHKIRLHT